MQQFDDPVITRTSQSSPPPVPTAPLIAKVLVVHRDASYRRTLCAYLAAQGFATVAHESGREALRDVSELAPDAVLMDLDGDDYDEFELLTCFASLPKRVAVIVCTAYGNSHGPEQAVLRDLGVRHILPRPCRFELIVRALREQLSHAVLPQPCAATLELAK